MEQEAWRRHQEQDHTPFRKRCPVCIAALAVPGIRWPRVVIGVWGMCFLASAFTIPLAPNSEDKAKARTAEKSNVEPVEIPGLMDLPDMAELVADDEPELLPVDLQGPSLKVVERRFRKKLPEPGAPLRADPEGVPAEPPPLPPPTEDPESQRLRLAPCLWLFRCGLGKFLGPRSLWSIGYRLSDSLFTVSCRSSKGASVRGPCAVAPGSRHTRLMDGR